MTITGTELEQAIDAAVRPLELAVVLPTYNERKNVATMVARLGTS